MSVHFVMAGLVFNKSIQTARESNAKKNSKIKKKKKCKLQIISVFYSTFLRENFVETISTKRDFIGKISIISWDP